MFVEVDGVWGRDLPLETCAHKERGGEKRTLDTKGETGRRRERARERERERERTSGWSSLVIVWLLITST